MRIAEINVRMICSFPYAKRLCSDFVIECQSPDVTVSVSPDEIQKEKEQYGENPFSDGYCEGICLYRAIAEKLPKLSGFVFHGAAVTVNGKGYIVTAPSGTGKTTHISLLLENYPDKVSIINGDKPIIRKIDGEWRICSTPWAGKEGWKVNATAPLSGIILVTRAKDNKIEEMDPSEYFDELIRQVYIPQSAEAQISTFELVDEMAQGVKFYKLECNMDKSAADTSFSMLK